MANKLYAQYKYRFEMIYVDNFYQGMDVILSQYESISETILSNCNII